MVLFDEEGPKVQDHQGPVPGDHVFFDVIIDVVVLLDGVVLLEGVLPIELELAVVDLGHLQKDLLQTSDAYAVVLYIQGVQAQVQLGEEVLEDLDFFDGDLELDLGRDVGQDARGRDEGFDEVDDLLVACLVELHYGQVVPAAELVL